MKVVYLQHASWPSAKYDVSKEVSQKTGNIVGKESTENQNNAILSLFTCLYVFFVLASGCEWLFVAVRRLKNTQEYWPHLMSHYYL